MNINYNGPLRFPVRRIDFTRSNHVPAVKFRYGDGFLALFYFFLVHQGNSNTTLIPRATLEVGEC
ncbi:hypothetical protein M408DRAFT_292832 [Serendipita vermifera MAFF 305830]|uniref:Uncharacterized protein n=1 Tax=Serendipita vermifera MAFF 305830 TaxID=933852 RepID=A0A0C3ASG7_SERVB|nr:hypothetical protein M408DRAFT_292832 [Serendipita vermifera MAFF 305830]